MPSEWKLKQPIPDDQSKAQDARDKFIRWWQDHQDFLISEHVVIPERAVITGPYYGAESITGRKR
jgi:hypothetical protein